MFAHSLFTFKRAVVVALTFCALAAISCSLPSGPPQAGGPTTMAQAARSVLRNLPELKVTLPASLSSNAGSTTAKTLSRAAGDTKDISTAPSLKSEAWFQLQSNNGFQTFINQAFQFLRTYANANAVPTDEAFTVPVSNADLANLFHVTPEMAADLTVTTRLLVSGADTAHFSIYALVGATMAGEHPFTMTTKARIDVVTVSGGQDLEFYMNMAMTMNDETQTIPFYAHYNTATGACDMTQRSTSVDRDDPQITHLYESLQRSLVGPNNEITSISVSRDDGQPSYVRVAFGDDIAGGIANYDSSSDGEGNSYDYYWGEYYGTNGNLLKRVNGQTKLWVPIWTGSGAPPQLNLKDLGYAVAPPTVEQRSYWDQTAQANVTEVQTSPSGWMPVWRSKWSGNDYASEYYDGTSWHAASGWWSRSIVFRWSDDPATWSGGDAIYYWQSSSSEGIYWKNTLYQGYVVPQPVNRFDKDFFVTNEYPIDAILPLQGSYATDYKLIQQEGETYEDDWTWTDEDGTVHNDHWSSTSYSYYLNKNTEGEIPIRQDESQGDIGLDDKLSDYEMYYWVNGQETKVKGYFYRTTAASPPAYFKTPDNSLVSRVDAKLDQVMDDAFLIDTTIYSAQLTIAEGDPTQGKFGP